MIEEIEVFQYKGGKAGAHVTVLAEMHGNEVCGKEAADKVRNQLDNGLELEAGTLTIVPVCNPLADRAGKPWVEGRNLNRMVRHYKNPANAEEYFADQIAGLIDRSDAVLDLHSCVAKADPFLILDYRSPHADAFAAAQGIQRWITGWPQMNAAVETLDDPDTMHYAFSQGKYGVVIECGQNSDPAAVDVGYNCIRRSLAHFGMLAYNNDLAAFHQPEIYDIRGVVINKGGAELIPEPVNLGAIHAGQPIARYPDGRIVHAPFSGAMVLPSKTADLGKDLTYLAQLISAPGSKVLLDILADFKPQGEPMRYTL